MRAVFAVVAALLSACTSTVDRTELLMSMESRVSMKGSHINILWYRGTKDHFHYLSHVYAMFGADDYRVSDADVHIPAEEMFPLTSDSTKYKRIARIGDGWAASRKNSADDLWGPELEGLVLDRDAPCSE